MGSRRSALAAAVSLIALIAAAVVVANGISTVGVDECPGASAPESAPFPVLDTAALSVTQRGIVEVLHTQFEAQPPGTTFSENVEEPWCADFVSWVMRRAGVPLKSPNSRSWRNPGVYTLQKHFAAAGRLLPVGSLPQAGDVMLWGPDSAMGLHANVVVTAGDSTITTVGGNEGGTRVRHNRVDEHDILRFGRPF